MLTQTTHPWHKVSGSHKIGLILAHTKTSLDYLFIFTVNLFNCSGSKAECGICVLTSQRHPECSWCANEKVCTEDCSDGGFTDIASCPTARIDQVGMFVGILMAICIRFFTLLPECWGLVYRSASPAKESLYT